MIKNQDLFIFKFLVDESSGKKLHFYLLDCGYDSKFVGDIMLSAPDEEILALAEKEGRTLITNDKDFGELIFRFNKPSSGVLLLRLRLDSPKSRQKYVSFTINKFSDYLTNHFLIVTEHQIRMRKI